MELTGLDLFPKLLEVGLVLWGLCQWESPIEKPAHRMAFLPALLE
jgi:hypothetical protein